MALNPSGGNVGIGTTAPAAQLALYGAGQTTGKFSTSSSLGGSLVLQDSGASPGNGGSLIFGFNQGNFAGIKGYAQDGTSNTRGDILFATRYGVTDTTLTERMRITWNGAVGIGTTAPTAKLTVGDGAAAPGGLATLNLTGANTAPQSSARPGLYHRHMVGLGVFSDYAMSFEVNGATSLSEAMRIDNTGRVGIGTTSPGYDLQVYRAPDPQIGVQSTAGSLRMGISTGGGTIVVSALSQSAVITNDNGPLHLGTAANPPSYPRMTIDTSGLVGIGTTQPSNTLQVEGSIHTDGNPIYLRSGPTDHNDFVKWNSSVDRVDVAGWNGANLGYTNSDGSMHTTLTTTSGGTVGINSTSPGATLDVNGSAKIGGGSVVNKISFGRYVGSHSCNGWNQFNIDVGADWAGSGRVFFTAHEMDASLGSCVFQPGDAVVNGSGTILVRVYCAYGSTLGIRIDYMLIR